MRFSVRPTSRSRSPTSAGEPDARLRRCWPCGGRGWFIPFAAGRQSARTPWLGDRHSRKDSLEPITTSAAGTVSADASPARADRPRLVLTGEQDLAMAGLGPALAADAFAPFLIHGVTGSGKTEVYLSGDRAGRGQGPPGDRAGSRNQSHSADDPPVPRRFGRWPCCTAT